MGKLADGAVDRADWKDGKKDKYLIRKLQAQSDMGKRAGNSWKKEAWSTVARQVNKKFNVCYSLQQYKSRVDVLKIEYKIFKSLKDNSGFGWDYERNVPTAPDSVWDRLVESNKKYKGWRDREFPLFEELAALFDGAIATGKHVNEMKDVLEERQPSPEAVDTSQRGSSSGDDSLSNASCHESLRQDDDDDGSQTSLSGESSISVPISKRRKISRKGGVHNADTPTSRAAGPKPDTPRSRSAALMLADSFAKFVDNISPANNVATASTSMSTTPADIIIKAVNILVNDYTNVLSDQELAAVIDLMSEPYKCTILCAMPPGQARDAWVFMQASRRQ